MKKKSFLISTLGLIGLLASCNTVVNNTTTSTNSGSNTGSSNNSNVSETNVSNDFTATQEFNVTTASGLAPVVNINSIDTSVLTTENSGSVYEVNADNVISETLYNGLDITAAKNSTINLTLNNATIYQNSETGKALWNDNKGLTLNLIIPDGTTSYIYNNFDDTNAVHIKGNLNITGGGTLVVISGSKSAIKVSKKITVTNTTLSLQAANYGISCEEVELTNANVTIPYAGKDGIRASVENEDVSTAPTFDDTIGYVKLVDTNYSATVEGDGIQANTSLYISGGSINIQTQGTFVSYSADNIEQYELTNDDFKWSKSGNSYKKISSDEIGTNYSRYLALVQSSKGLKVGALKYTLTDSTEEKEVATTSYNLTITNDAVVNITSTDSGIKVDYGDALINSNAVVTINAGNKGVAAKHNFTIEDEAILTVTNSYEGVEAALLNFNGGTSIISASDDGLNASTDYTTNDYKTLAIYVNSGLLKVNAQGDGLDSNGTIYFNGGLTLITGPTSGGNQAIDSDSKAYFNGGEVLSIGSSGMASTKEYSSSNSTCVFGLYQSYSSNTTISILDSDGNVLISVVAPTSFGELVYSSSSLKLNSTYTVVIGSTNQTITLTSQVTSSGNSNIGFGPGNDGGHGDNPGMIGRR